MTILSSTVSSQHSDGPRDFFVSYTSADRSWAEWVAFELENQGYTVTIQQWDFQPGDNFVDLIDRATQSTKHTIAILSKRYVSKAFPRMEMASSIAADPLGSLRRFIPILIENFELSGLLSSIVHIDLTGLDEETARQSLSRGIKLSSTRSRGKPTVSPLFPNSARTTQAVRGPTESPDVNGDLAQRRINRFIQARVMSGDWLRSTVVGNPYRDGVDPTDLMASSAPISITAVFWIPNAHYFQAKDLSPFTPVTAICTPDPSHLLNQVRSELGPELYGKLSLATSKVFNEDRQRLFSAIGHAIRQSFVTCVAVPESLLEPGKSKPSLGFQALIDLLFAPILSLHRTIGVNQFRVYVVDAGSESSFVIGQCKKVAKAIFSGPACPYTVDLSSASQDAQDIAHLGRFLAWASGCAHNTGNPRWTTLVEHASNE